MHLALVLDIVGILVIAVSLFFPFHFFLPPWAHRDVSLEVEAYKTVYIECDFFMGSVVRGMVLTPGEGKRDIDFYMEDSSGQSVLAREGIEERYFFEFHPQNTGLYRLVLDNKMETPRSVYVIIWQYYYNILFSCLGLGVFICGVALIVTAPS